MYSDKNICGMTILADHKPLAHGSVRDVWDRPDQPGQILKTVRAQKRKKYSQRSVVRRAIDNLRLGPYRTFDVEYHCYLKTAYDCMRLQRPLPIAEVGGIILTDLGLAQVGEKITDSTGQLAQTLKSILCSNNLDSERLGWLNDFVTTLFDLNANVPDLRAVNVVIDETKKRFVLVDGYGDKTLVPLLSWVRPLNQKYLDIQFSKMEEYGCLKWRSETKNFCFAE